MNKISIICVYRAGNIDLRGWLGLVYMYISIWLRRAEKFKSGDQVLQSGLGPRCLTAQPFGFEKYICHMGWSS